MRRRARAATRMVRWSWLSLSCLLLSCGARSNLYGGFPCQREGETQACEGVCGAGEMQCVAGYWSSCEIPVQRETCTNDCGEGIRTCQEERWSECLVEPREESCETVCGVGTRSCEDDEWSDCRVERVERECRNKCGTGIEICERDAWSVCSAPQPLPPVLQARVRDFLDSHPDFENGSSGVDLGIVAPTLGADGKPVYALSVGHTLTTTGSQNFDQWYRDVPGVNATKTVELPLRVSAEDPRLYVYAQYGFFPIDDLLFGNQGRAHNYHFTLEASGSFIYQGGEIFRFTGDDDVFVFINGQLVIDLGGLHESLSAEVQIDEFARATGLRIGDEAELHIFFAERHTVESNFVIETSIAGLGECPSPEGAPAR